MFCAKCGANVPDGVKFCSVCGQPVETAAPAAPVYEAPVAPAPVYGAPVAPAPKKANVKLIAIIAGAAALVLVLCLVLFSGGGAEAAFDDYFDAYFGCDLSNVEDLMPEALWNDAKITPEQMENLGDAQKERLGKKYEGLDLDSFDYEILAVEEMKDEQMKQFRAMMKVFKSPVEVGDVCNLHVELRAETTSGEEWCDVKEYLAIELDGDWCIMEGNTIGALNFTGLIKK